MKSFLHIKVKAGALQYTIFIAVVIALLVFAFIGLTYVNQKLRLKNTVFKDVVYQNKLAFNYIKKNLIPYDELLRLPLANDENIQTTVTKKHWGIFDIVTVSSKKRNEEFTQIALLGGHQEERPSLYLQDDNQPLVVVGTTKIEGTTFLPKQSVKQGSIAGHSYIRPQLVYGTIQKSKKQLPTAINLEQLKKIKDSINIITSFESLELIEGERIVSEFNKPTQLLRANHSIELIDVELVGNIIIQSSSRIIIHKSSVIRDVILIAPEIEIKEKVQGNFQAIAEKSLKVGENVVLNYPTSLLLLEKKFVSENQQTQHENNYQIKIDKNSVVKGIVVFLTENKDDNYKAQIIIEEKSEIVGEVYCNQNIELKGAVVGSVYTKGFIANQFGSVYKNHIYNGQIINTELPKQYAGLTFKKSNQNVAKWLYY